MSKLPAQILKAIVRTRFAFGDFLKNNATQINIEIEQRGATIRIIVSMSINFSVCLLDKT